MPGHDVNIVPRITSVIPRYPVVAASHATAVTIRTYAEPVTAICTMVVASSACTIPTVSIAKSASPVSTETPSVRIAKTVDATYWALTRLRVRATIVPDNVHACRTS